MDSPKYELAEDLLVCPRASSGRGKLSTYLLRIMKELSSASGADALRIFFDAGGYRGAVFVHLEATKKVIFLTRTVRYSKNVEQWKKVNDFVLSYPQDKDLPE